MPTADAVIQIRAQDKTQKAFRSVQSNLGKTQKSFRALGTAVKIGFTAVIAGGISRMVNFTDQFSLLEARTKKASKGLGDYNQISGELFKISQKTGTALEDTVKLFESLARTAPDIGATRDQVLQMTDSLEKMAIVSGASNVEISNAMRQFSQAMAGGVVRAEEFNSIIENTPEIAAKIAEGMGMTIGQLRLAVVEGKVLSKDVFESILGQTGQINEDFAAMPMTFSRAMTMLKNSLQVFLGVLNEAGGATGVLADAVAGIARFFDGLVSRIRSGRLAAEFSSWNEALRSFGGYLSQIGKGFTELFKGISGNINVFDAFLDFPDTFRALVVSFAASMDKAFVGIEYAWKITINKMRLIWNEFKKWVLNIWFNTLSAMVKALDAIGLEKMAAAVERAAGRVEGSMIGMARGSQYLRDQIDKLNESRDREIEAIDGVATEMVGEIQAQKEANKVLREGIVEIDTATESMYDLGNELVSTEQKTNKFKDAFSDMFEDIKGAWGTMWEGIFTGNAINSVKDFLKEVKNIFLKTLAEIAAVYTWEKIFGGLTGGASAGIDIVGAITKIFSKGAGGGISKGVPAIWEFAGLGGTGGTAAGGIGSSIMSGLGSIGTAIKSVFSSITSSVTTAGTAAGSGFVSSVGSALSAGAGILGPLAIAAFGFAKISKKKKELKAEFRSLMSDNAITSRLTTEKLVGDYNVLGEHGGRTYVQIGATAAKMYEGIGMWSGKAFGLQRFAMQEMKDEFGNVIIRANNFNELMSILERQEPFVKQAQDLLDLHGPSVIAKEGIELVNSELVRADQAFAQMGQSGVNALMAVNTKSNQYQNIMQKGFVTATQMAQMGLEGFGHMSADVFDIIVRGVQDSEGAMNSLAEAAQIAIDKGRQAASFGGGGGGLQHGGSFIVGGGGGTDSQRVSFMATPGERVTVETPNQQRASGSDGGGVVKELRALRADLANVVAKPIVGAVSRGQLAMAGMGRH